MRRRIALVLIAVAATAVGLAAREIGAGRELELESVDLRFQIRGAQPPPDEVVLVQVDDETLSALLVAAICAALIVVPGFILLYTLDQKSLLPDEGVD